MMLVIVVMMSVCPPQVEEEHAATLRSLSQSHQSQMCRLMGQLEEERERSRSLTAQVTALQKGQEMGDDIITSLCRTSTDTKQLG